MALASNERQLRMGMGKHAKPATDGPASAGKPTPRGTLVRIALLLILKYAFPLVALGVGSYLLHDWRYLLAGALELAAIFLSTNWLARKSALLGSLVNGLLMLVFNVQAVVLVFASGYITPIMLSNIFNIQDLVGKAALYVSGAVLAFVLSFLPIAGVGPQVLLRFLPALALAAACEAAACLGVGMDYGPMASTVQLVDAWNSYQQAISELSGSKTGVDPTTTPYFHDDVPGGVDRPASLPSQPNVIAIFVEGLSQQIVDDPRGIMPRVASYEGRSLNFTGYYNHTAATFRALNGQLYSGYQLNDLDANALIPIQAILRVQGYHTTLINTEPYYDSWTDFLGYMDFDEMVGESSTGTYSIPGTSDGAKMSDGEAFQTLRDVVEREHGSGSPFFVAMYTFGTHASLDSPEERFGNGSSPMLNKFYNCDYQFGQFMDWFEGSELADDTIVVFTADHACYSELDFTTAFPDYQRDHYFCDEIPCFYYYRGVEPAMVDANGRTTLDFAPTLLDYLDVSGPNCFLGRSLFLDDDPDDLDTVYFDGNMLSTSTGGTIERPEGADSGVLLDQIRDYLSYARIPLD